MVDEVEAILGKDYFINKNKERRLSELDQMNIVDRTISKWGGDPDEIKSFARRIAAEEAGMIPGAVLGGQYGAGLGPWGRLGGMALGGAAGALPAAPRATPPWPSPASPRVEARRGDGRKSRGRTCASRASSSGGRCSSRSRCGCWSAPPTRCGSPLLS